MTKKRSICILWMVSALALLCLACNFGTGNLSELPKATPVQADTDNISFITPPPDLHREELDAILRRSTMLEGVSVGGVNVGGLTLSAAKEAVRAELSKIAKSYTVNIAFGSDTATLSGDMIPVTDDLDAKINEAFNILREDVGFDAVSREVEEIRTNGRDFPVSVHFEEASLKGAVETFAKEHEIAPVNASVAFDREENAVKFTDDIPGKSVDCEALLALLLEAKSGETVEAPTVEVAAEINSENVREHYVLRGKMTTDFSKSINNRKFNICKGAGMITGTVLHPGDTFSANKTLGVRNKANGWKTANAYVAGGHEKQYGGGVCQLSTTLYNAAVIADMKIVDRRNHSMPVDYIHKGLDATINSVGNIIDFKFQNSSKADIIIIAYVDNDEYKKAGKLTMEIWGIPISEDSEGKYDEIRIPEPKKLKTIKPSGDDEYQVDVTKKPGYKELLVKNQNGSVWQSYVEYYLNGELVERKELAQSTYKAFNKVYLVGPDATPEPDTTPKPSKSSDPDDPDPTHGSDPDPTKQPDPTKEPDTPKPTAEPPKDTPEPSDDGGGE